MQQGLRGLHALRGAGADALGKEAQPALPVARQPHCIQQPVVQRPLRFEKQTGVQKRFLQDTVGHQLQHDQHAAHTAVAVQKRVDGFELHRDGVTSRWGQVSNLKSFIFKT
jgi:hypothetical protein